jgi:predicted MPP superfamily phosphohydrolase
VAEIATAGGVRILRDESHVIHRGDASLALLGIDDTGNASSAIQRIARASTNIDEHSTKLLLCHRPYFLPEASHTGIHLMLSGHTHGGQVVLGRFGDMTITPAALASPYVAGLYNEGMTQMYVSRGVGTVGIPVRVNCPPEITRIVIKPA